MPLADRSTVDPEWMPPRPAQDRLRSVGRSASPGRPLSERSARRFQPAQHHAALVLVLLVASRLGVVADGEDDRTCDFTSKFSCGCTGLSSFSILTITGASYIKSAGKCPTTPVSSMGSTASLQACAAQCSSTSWCKSFEWQDNNWCSCKLFGTAVTGTNDGSHHWCFTLRTLAPTRVPTLRYRPSVCEVPIQPPSW